MKKADGGDETRPDEGEPDGAAGRSASTSFRRKNVWNCGSKKNFLTVMLIIFSVFCVLEARMVEV